MNPKIRTLLTKCNLSQELLVKEVLRIIEEETKQIEEKILRFEKEKKDQDEWGKYLWQRLQNIAKESPVRISFEALKEQFKRMKQGQNP